ncbi:hypothetical protein GWK47_026292 [Chionoecetes opilio]|uniref:Uncharacterized protein n=1 Tax=Chionoecetes opilio TaxID=41210 RepID=A0A8J8WNJ1_CHIOP|nr:hypothetical protein GWK47_026292 [Chionoecetes opilio]
MCQRGGGVARSTPNITSLGVWRTMRAALPSHPLSSPPTCRLGGGGRAGPQGGGGGQRANAVHADPEYISWRTDILPLQRSVPYASSTTRNSLCTAVYCTLRYTILCSSLTLFSVSFRVLTLPLGQACP